MSKSLKPAGRKSDLQTWHEDGEAKTIAKKIRALASKGAKRGDIRKKLNIPYAKWRQMMSHEEYTYYKKALEQGEETAIEEVAHALKNRAIGYTYEEIKDDQARGRTITTKHVPGDVKAAIFFLKNKDPDNWKDKVEHDTTITVEQEEVDYTKLSAKQLKEITDAVKSIPEIERIN